MRVVLVHARAARQVQELTLDLADGSTVRDVLQLAGWHDQPGDSEQLVASIWGRKVAWDSVLREGDRVELCRPLRVDPKVARRERFVGQGARSTGLFARRRPGSKSGY